MSVRAAVRKRGIIGDASSNLTRKVLSCPVFDLGGVIDGVMSEFQKQYAKLKHDGKSVTVEDFGLDLAGPSPFPVCLIELGPMPIEGISHDRGILFDGDVFFPLLAKAGSKTTVPTQPPNLWKTLEAVTRKIINDRRRVTIARKDPSRKALKQNDDVVYHVVKLTAGRTPEGYGKLLARAQRMAERAAPRRHEVRSHDRHYKSGAVKTIKAYKRGRGGIVEKDYVVDGT